MFTIPFLAQFLSEKEVYVTIPAFFVFFSFLKLSQQFL